MSTAHSPPPTVHSFFSHRWHVFPTGNTGCLLFYTLAKKTLIFQDGLNTIVKDTLQACEFDKDMQTIAKTAKIIRKDILSHKGFQFDGHFDETCQMDAIPSTLKTLVSMIINGTS